MSELIHVRYLCTIEGSIHFGQDTSNFYFRVPTDDGMSVSVEIIQAQKEVAASYQVEVREAIWNFLNSGVFEQVPKELLNDLSSITTPVSNAIRRVLSLIKYGLNNISLNEELFAIKSTQWSVDGVQWKIWPTQVYVTFDAYGTHPLNNSTALAIQQCLQDTIEPFLALRHLHRARTERIPRHKWLEATIAAELAIKEFLITLKPELETLLLEMPSPPLHKLYGSILESFGLPRSPKIREISKGVEIRNKLIHRPHEHKITLEEANTYVHDIEVAVYSLLILLYPDNSAVRYFYFLKTQEYPDTVKM